MNLLTDDEINTMADEYLENYRIAAGCALNFGRDVEQAVLSKLAAGVSVEPITELIYTSQGYYTLTQLNTAIAAARVAAISTLKLCDPDALGLEQGDDCATGVYRVEKAIRALIGGSK